MSVWKRNRSARFGYEHYRARQQTPGSKDADRNYQFINIWWGSPTHHRWWARSVHLYINL